MNTLPLANRYSPSSHASPAVVHPIADHTDHAEGQPPVQAGRDDMHWPDLEQPGGLAVQWGEVGEAGEAHHVVVLHPQPPQAGAQVVNVAEQVNPAFVAAVVAIQDEIAHPPLPVAPLEVLAPQAPQRRSLCDTESLVGCGAITLTLGAVTSVIVGGVLAFTSEDHQLQHDGFIAFCAGASVISTWCCVSVCTGD